MNIPDTQTSLRAALYLRTGKSGRYRYYTCSMRARQGETGCTGRTVPMDKLDTLVVRHLEERLLAPARLREIPESVMARRKARAAQADTHIAELHRRAGEAGQHLARLYEAIETGIADLNDPALNDLGQCLAVERAIALAPVQSVCLHLLHCLKGLRQAGNRHSLLWHREAPSCGSL